MNKKKKLLIVRSLVGPVTDAMFGEMSKNVQMYLTPNVSLFIPFIDYCDYAVTPQHTHPGYSFIYNYSGVGEVRVYNTIKKSPFENKPNICAFSPDVPHEEIMHEQFKCYIAIVINKKFYERELQHYQSSSPVLFEGVYFPGSNLILNTLKRFIIECDDELPCRDRLLEGLALDITHMLIRHCTSNQNTDVAICQKVEINQLIGYLNEGYAKKITVDDMAKMVNLSTSHFSRVFKEETGTTPVEFLNNLRLQKAKMHLLSKERNITEIALACGFSSSSYFTNCFMERMGVTPSVYRKNRHSKG